MNKFVKKASSLLAVITLALAFNIVALAQGTTSISLSKSNIAVGDSTTVSITATDSGTVTVKYTASLLSLTSCTASGYTSEGNTVTFSGKSGDLVFTASSEGTASIIVSSSSCSGSSTTLTIGGSSATTDTSAEESASNEEAVETAETSETTEVADEAATTSVVGTGVGTLNADGGFDIDGVAYVVSERYSDSEIPSGFSKTTITIGSSTYNELTNNAITLLYLKPADNTSGSGVFYVYDESAGTVALFQMIGTSDNYVIVSTAESAISSALTETTLDADGVSCMAYTADGSEFYYIYGTNQDGVTGWFMYDSAYGSISRADELGLATVSSVSSTDTADDSTTTTYDATENYVNKLDLFRKLISALVILCVILLFVIINMAIKGKGRGNSGDDDDDDDDDDFDGDVFAKTPKKSSRSIPRSIVFESQDDDDDDDLPIMAGESKEPKNGSDKSLDMMDLNDL